MKRTSPNQVVLCCFPLELDPRARALFCSITCQQCQELVSTVVVQYCSDRDELFLTVHCHGAQETRVLNRIQYMEIMLHPEYLVKAAAFSSNKDRLISS